MNLVKVVYVLRSKVKRRIRHETPDLEHDMQDTRILSLTGQAVAEFLSEFERQAPLITSLPSLKARFAQSCCGLSSKAPLVCRVPYLRALGEPVLERCCPRICPPKRHDRQGQPRALTKSETPGDS